MSSGHELWAPEASRKIQLKTHKFKGWCGLICDSSRKRRLCWLCPLHIAQVLYRKVQGKLQGINPLVLSSDGTAIQTWPRPPSSSPCGEETPTHRKSRKLDAAGTKKREALPEKREAKFSAQPSTGQLEEGQGTGKATLLRPWDTVSASYDRVFLRYQRALMTLLH